MALICKQDDRGRPRREPRDFLNGILWILRTGAPWKDLPQRYLPYQWQDDTGDMATDCVYRL